MVHFKKFGQNPNPNSTLNLTLTLTKTETLTKADPKMTTLLGVINLLE